MTGGIDLSGIALPDRTAPLAIPWPLPGDPHGTLEFATPDAWRAFVASLDVDPGLPRPVRAKFGRALRLLLLAWVDADAVKAAEMAALAALELAVRDRYATAARTRSLSRLLAHMVVEDGLADGDIPIIARCGGTATGQLDGGTRPTLAERRNAMAHGDPFEGLPVPGLIELVSDLIDFAHRHYLAELRGSWPIASASSSSGA